MSDSLIDQLIEQGSLKTPQIIKAFRTIKRADFVTDQILSEITEQQVGDYNAPLEIGFGQTISQPLTVALMLELLQPQVGEKILDIGSGSGWQTAMLAHIVGKRGYVYAIELLAELKEFGQRNVAKYNFDNVEFIRGDGSKGLPLKAPFDKIIAAAAAQELPQVWLEQLKPGGRLVCPIKNSVWLFTKKDKKTIEKKEYPGFAFVPLIQK